MHRARAAPLLITLLLVTCSQPPWPRGPEEFEPAAGTGEISGMVVGADTGQPIHFAAVLISNTKVGVWTDSEGLFRIKHVPAGSYAVMADMMGYTSEVMDSVVVRSGRTTELTFELEPVPPQGIHEDRF